MTPIQEKDFKTAQAAVFERIKKFENGGTMPCESSLCDCPVRRRIGVTTFSCIVTPTYTIELVCAHGARRFAEFMNVPLK